MTAAKHTPEPWFVASVGYPDKPTNKSPRIWGSDRAGIADVCTRRSLGAADAPEEMANAARIVACVNACAGMDDPAAEIQMMRLQYKNVSGLLRAAEAQRDALAETLVSIRAMVDNHKPGQSGITMSQIYDRAGRALAKLDGGK